ncbi:MULTISPECIES: DUF6609 family protein [Carnobacterium]|jgi:cbb3-type cytochrome oxidase subunit 3|nr:MULTISPECIES: DUF6609 family protein [Carnobacterium]AOA02667.1 DUF3188 domain-containing protein [Carnobacterium maltaromaticum]KRN68181.1 hypothetical protein IV70_GL001714 [Carnobacterium maltaromaticum DSM 20342]KRN71337.1 hypothetical protein IV76_GL000834 [Carnobacterium maltaromaticum]KRN85871.1 hypothetical protein IV75_GL001585 [Carnobacterium maltaromaticum]MBC9789039.1 DUF3188 domain-containing protein [Carnobacterium maltaromaticum]
MQKNGLFVMSIGMLTIMSSAFGAEMKINYFILITGLFLIGTGFFIFRKGKSQGNEKTEGKK